MKKSLVLRRHEFNSLQGNNFMMWLRTVVGFTTIAFLYQLYFQDIKSPYLAYSSTVILFSLYLFFFIRYVKKTRVEISDFGIEYRSGLPEPFKALDPDWKAAWGEIQNVSFDRGIMGNLLITPLQIKLRNKTVKLLPVKWMIPNKSKKKLSLKEFFEALFKKKENAEVLVGNSPLMKVFENKGLLKRNVSLEKIEERITNINSNPVAIGMAFFFFVSIFYFIIDVYFGLSEFYVETPPYLWIVIVGVLIAFLAYLIVKTTELKTSEIIIMTVLVGFGASLVSYPLILRTNEWTDTDGLRSYSYKLVEKGIWKPEHNNLQLPDLTFDLRSSDFWSNFKIGAVKDYEIRKGGLDFYQLNMKPVYEEQRIFYDKKFN